MGGKCPETNSLGRGPRGPRWQLLLQDVLFAFNAYSRGPQKHQQMNQVMYLSMFPQHLQQRLLPKNVVSSEWTFSVPVVGNVDGSDDDGVSMDVNKERRS